MAHLTLINPPTVLCMGSLSYQNSIPPLGVAYLSAAAKAAGHTVQVIDAPGEAIEAFYPIEDSRDDLYLHGLTPAEVVARIDPASTLVGVSHMFLHTWPLLQKLVREIRAARPDVSIVVGGETPTAFWEEMMRVSPEIDVCVLGEGEALLVELLDAADRGEPWSELPAVVYRDEAGNALRSEGRRERQVKLDTIPLPDWEAINVEGYLRGHFASGVNRGRSMPMLGTRGCPYRCTFCSSPNMWTTRYVMRDPKEVVDEIESYVRRYRIDNIDFLDLTAIVNRRWILAFCEELEGRDFRISWQLPSGTRSEAIDREVAEALYRSGCRNIGYSPETGSPRMLKLIKKQVNLDSMVESVEASVGAGMITSCAIILGLPDDRLRDVWLSYKLLVKLAFKGMHGVAVMIFAPYPGSELFDRLRKEGRLEIDDDYIFSALLRSGRSSKSYNQFSRPTLLAMQMTFLLTFWGLQYLLRPRRLLATLGQLFRKGQEQSLMDKLLQTKLAFRKRRQQAGLPVSLALEPVDSP